MMRCRNCGVELDYSPESRAHVCGPTALTRKVIGPEVHTMHLNDGAISERLINAVQFGLVSHDAAMHVTYVGEGDHFGFVIGIPVERLVNEEKSYFPLVIMPRELAGLRDVCQKLIDQYEAGLFDKGAQAPESN